ncbi:MAG: bifunctional adenosylcobinamide kinase/adenosylcobinamide-phosphate guanylyltransferase [Deltaproteobacteria bacterium]|nr:bifunctional adenosylcobinamide kinase/adenosylcobinamide-phosphate guanylyltransferase [Deltaproteobacteria bacterium]
MKIKKKLVLVLGGTRSGKSSYVLNEAEKLKGKKAFVATAEPLDEEMKERITKHRKSRSQVWKTFEEPLDLVRTLNNLKDDYGVVIIDCLTLWLSNIMEKWGDEPDRVPGEMDKLIKICSEFPGYLYLVSNEVGMGIVPENRTARIFRDLSGELNKGLAIISDKVVVMHAGIPTVIKEKD